MHNVKRAFCHSELLFTICRTQQATLWQHERITNFCDRQRCSAVCNLRRVALSDCVLF